MTMTSGGAIADQPARAASETRLSVLIADDEPLVAELIALQLQKIGYRTRTVGDGRAALAAIAAGGIDVLITDWQMPELDGIGLARALRADPPDHYLHIIMMTTPAGQRTVQSALEVEVDTFLYKPVDPVALELTLGSAQRIVMLEQNLRRQNDALATANLRTQKAYDSLKADLDAAADNQRRILPAARLDGGFRHAGLYLPCHDLGGDSYGVLDLGADRHLFFLVDVCGHGVQAALHSFLIHHRLAAMAPDTPEALAAAAAELNALALREGDDSYFTMVAGIVETRERRVWLLRAGHPRPLLVGNGEVQAFDEGGPPIGLLPSLDYPVTPIAFADGQRLLLYSDGITECADRSGTRLGQDGLARLALDHVDRPLDGFLTALESHLVADYCGADSFEDDLSMLVLELSAS